MLVPEALMGRYLSVTCKSCTCTAKVPLKLANIKIAKSRYEGWLFPEALMWRYLSVTCKSCTCTAKVPLKLANIKIAKSRYEG